MSQIVFQHPLSKAAPVEIDLADQVHAFGFSAPSEQSFYRYRGDDGTVSHFVRAWAASKSGMTCLWVSTEASMSRMELTATGTS